MRRVINGISQLRRRPDLRAAALLLLAVAAGATACGSASPASTPGTIPAGLNGFQVTVKGSTTGSGVRQLSASLAESVGKGICGQLAQGETPAEISRGALSQSEGEFPPEAFAELMVDASQWLCPKYAAEVQQFSQAT